MQDTTADLFLSMSITFAVFGIAYYYLTTRSKERLAILEKGLPNDFFKDNASFLPFILLLGLVGIGIALGIIMGALLESIVAERFRSVMVPFCIFLFLGLSLVSSYFILKTILKRD
jgi:hypothetical protein